jgi:succinylarginine dihydrolase
MDTLVGMTHHFGGHAKGNYASMRHQGEHSNPKQAALQGLRKMIRVMESGTPQLVLPPQNRPHLKSLQKLGLHGKLQEQLEELFQTAPNTLAKLSSSAFIWTANAATVLPSSDTQDQKVHFHTANLNSHFHREIEAEDRHLLFNVVFNNPNYFVHHAPLASSEFRDEGAANHTRLEGGFHVFVYGDPTGTTPGFEGIPRRQSLEAQKLISFTSGLDDHQVLYLQQSDRALKAGVFHNDVAAVGFGNTYLCHEEAYRGGLNDLEKLTTWYNMSSEKELNLIVVSQDELDLEEAVHTYLFNTQWINLQDGSLLVLTPKQCQFNQQAQAVIQSWSDSHPKWRFEYFDLEQSMNNGGGPACCRLRIPLTDQEYLQVHSGIKLNPKKASVLSTWINQHYPEQFDLHDLLNPDFRAKQDIALQELYDILELPKFLLEQSHE